MKKSQVTIFVILGLLILVTLIIFFNKKPEMEEDDALISFDQVKKNFEEYINQCVEIATDNSINRYGLEYIDEQVEYYIEKHIFECMDDFNEFKKMGYTIVSSSPNIELLIDEKNVETTLNVNITFSKGNKKAEFSKFRAKLIYPEDFQDPNKGFEWKFRGILYKYEETDIPRPLHIFVAKVDLEDPTLSYYVTPKLAPNVMITSDFLIMNGLQFAVNGGGFDIRTTNEVNGYAAYNGIAYSLPNITPGETIFVTENNEIFLSDSIPERMKYAITGFNHMVEGGKIPEKFLNKNDPRHKVGYDNLEPRTSIGKDEKNNWLIIFVIDGRDPGISEGVDLKELGELHLTYGSTTAYNMDGGGSSTLVMQEGTSFKVYNNPSDGAERPVANHFGIFAEKINIAYNNQQTNLPNADPQDSNINLFRHVTSNIAAGAQPSEAGYLWLASQGYKTVIDVQGIDNSAAVNAAGMRYIYLPFDGYPPSNSWINNVLSAMTNQDYLPAYIHCQYGVHRTGVAIALYRETKEGVCYNDAYNELMNWANNYFPGTDEEKNSVFQKIESYANC